MKKEAKWVNILYTIGVVAIILGAIDPLEGSVIILAGISLIAFASHKRMSSYKERFFLSFILILFGVASLWYLSSIGGFGATSELSWGWALLIIPYPVGWLLAIISIFQKRKRRANNRKY